MTYKMSRTASAAAARHRYAQRRRLYIATQQLLDHGNDTVGQVRERFGRIGEIAPTHGKGLAMWNGFDWTRVPNNVTR